MIRKILTAALVGGSLALSGCASMDSMSSSAADMLQDDALVSGLTSGLGLDAEQAAGGLGSILSLAQNKLPKADYDAISKVMPNAEQYVKMAKEAGVLTDPITDMGRLNSAMNKLGISPSTASQMYSQVGNFLGSAGAESAKNALMGLLG